MNDFPLKVVFFGNNPQILECLSSVSNIVAVYTRPDDGTNENVNAVKAFSTQLGISVFQPSKKELYEHTDFLQMADIDLIIVCGYKFIIPREIFSIPRNSTINIHPSMLPRYRGQHVINWAIVNGESETGVSLHFMEETLDTGNIIIQKSIPIYFEDTAKDLHDRIYAEACSLLRKVIQDLKQSKTLKSTVQDSSVATFFKPRKPEDGHIDWNNKSVNIYNLIRSLAKPWPGAFSYIKGHKVLIWDAQIKPSMGAFPSDLSHGKIINIDRDYISVSTTDGEIIITEYEIINTDVSTKHILLKKGEFFT